MVTATGVQSDFTLSQRSLRPSTLPRAVRPAIELVRRSNGAGFTRSKKHTHQLLGLSSATPSKRSAAGILLQSASCSTAARPMTRAKTSVWSEDESNCWLAESSSSLVWCVAVD